MNTTTAINFIYGYIDPRNGQLRYLGLSSIGMVRPLKFKGHSAHCLSWIKNLGKDGLVPEIEIFEEYSNEISFKELGDEETWYIAYYKFIGCDLTNQNLGGEGNKGHRHTPETKKIIGAATTRHKTGTKHSAASKTKMRIAKLGTKQSEETKLKRSVALTGRKQKPEEIAHRAAAVAKPIICVETGRIFMGGAAEVTRKLHISSGNVCSVARGDRARAGGHKFEYYVP